MSKHFIIIGNSRTGSTWLTTALNNVSGISTDFEVKIPPINYELLPNHHLLDKNFESLFWRRLPDDEILGTKLILDPKPHYNLAEQIDLAISKNTKIIFLKRCLSAQTLSQLKYGMVNILDESVNQSSNKIMERLKIETERVQKMSPRDIKVSPQSVKLFMRSLMIRAANDLMIHNFLSNGPRAHLIVDYDEIHERFTDILQFVGHSCVKNNINLDDVSVTKKVNKELTSTERGFREFGLEFNILRDSFLKQQKVCQKTINNLYGY